MNDLKIFSNEEFGQVRAVEKDGQPWFVAKDVCEILDLTNPTVAVSRLDQDEVTKFNLGGLVGETNLVNEYGLYSLILGSRKPEAKSFKRWITHEVIPSIRKHGAYVTDNVMDEILNNPEFGIKLLTELKAEREEKLKLQKQIESNKSKVIFAEALEISQSSVLVGELAKLLARNGIDDMGQNRLFKWLRQNGYLHKGGEQYNLPTQKSIELEIMEVKTTTVNNPDGSVRVTKTPKVTGKGQIYFVNKFKDEIEKQAI